MLCCWHQLVVDWAFDVKIYGFWKVWKLLFFSSSKLFTNYSIVYDSLPNILLS